MRQRIDPDFEFSWAPALWAAGTVVLVTIIGIVIFANPGTFGYGVVLGGLVASLRSGYYDNAGHNAIVGVILANAAGLFLVIVLGVFFGSLEMLFMTTSVGLAWFLIVAVIFLPVAYISALAGNFLRKKVGGPIGYEM